MCGPLFRELQTNWEKHKARLNQLETELSIQFLQICPNLHSSALETLAVLQREGLNNCSPATNTCHMQISMSRCGDGEKNELD